MYVPDWVRTALAGLTRAGKDRRVVLCGPVLVAVGLRVACLTVQPLWWDEGWSLYFATANIRTMLELTAVDIHPPLYYLLLHLWIGLFGSGVVSVRLLSVLIGTATVPLLYVTGRRLVGNAGGLAAAFLLAISPLHVYYSQEVRMYGLVALLGLAAFYFSLEWTGGNGGAGRAAIGSRWSRVGYVAAAAAALYTQYYAAFLILALNLVFAIRWLRGQRASRTLFSWLAAQAAVLLLFLPWVWYAGGKLWSYVRYKVGVEQDVSLGLFPYLGRHLAAFTWGHAEGALAGWWWVGLVPPAILLLFLFGYWILEIRDSSATRHQPSSVLGLSSLILAVILGCGFAANLAAPFNPPRSERLLLLALPAYLTLVAALLLALWQRRRTAAWMAAASFVVAAAVSLGFFYTTPRYAQDDYRPVAERVGSLGLPGDAVLAVHPWQVGYFQAYLPDDKSRPALVLTPREVLPRERQLWADEPARMAADLDALLANHGRLWFLDHQAMGRVLESRIEAYLVDHAYPVLSEWSGENTVLSFFAAGEPAEPGATGKFGDWLTLESAGLSPGPLESGWGIVAVDLSWQVSERPGEAYSVGLRLVDQAGHVWAQRDAPPCGGLEPFSQWPAGQSRLDRHGLFVPAGTPPGDYSLTLRVYRSEDLAVLPASFEGGSGGEMVLGTVHVVRPQSPPPVEALSFEQPLRAVFGDRLELLGVNVADGSPYLPGQAVAVDLFWQAPADPGEDFLPRLQLVDAAGEVRAELVEKPVAGTYPTAWWRAGELVRDPHALPVAATVAPGRYRLALSLVRAADGQLVEAGRGQPAVDLAEIEVLGREHNYEPPTAEHAQTARFGASVELVGYDLVDTAAEPGSTLDVVLHWHAVETPDRNYRSFVHLLDGGGGIVAQHDGLPARGELPTLGWLPGEYLVDSHRLSLPVDLPPGEYRLSVGLYDPVTLQRPGEPSLLDTAVVVKDD